MSMNTCACGKVYDTDYQMETDKNGEMICDECHEKEENKQEAQRETHLLELLSSIKQNCSKDIKLLSSQYTFDGIEATIEDVGFDNQKYMLTIRRLDEKTVEEN